MSLTADQPTDLAEVTAKEIKGRSLLQDAKRRFYRNKDHGCFSRRLSYDIQGQRCLHF